MEGTYKVCQVHMSISVEENVVWLYVTVDDILAVNISQGTA